MIQVEWSILQPVGNEVSGEATAQDIVLLHR